MNFFNGTSNGFTCFWNEVFQLFIFIDFLFTNMTGIF